MVTDIRVRRKKQMLKIKNERMIATKKAVNEYKKALVASKAKEKAQITAAKKEAKKTEAKTAAPTAPAKK